MGMRYSGIAALVLSSMAALPAAATTFITGTTTVQGVTLTFGPHPTDLSDKIKGNGAVNGTDLPLITDSGFLVDFTSPTSLHQSGGAGFAAVTGVANGNNNAGFSSLTITPRPSDPMTHYVGVNGFDAINFALSSLGRGNHAYYGDVVLNLLGGGAITFSNVEFDTNGNQHFGISSNDNRIFSSITFDNLWSFNQDGVRLDAQKFDSIRQVSIDLANSRGGGVPEPATWAMMIMGFGAIGGTMRIRGRKVRTAV